jgi:hypothetical protein
MSNYSVQVRYLHNLACYQLRVSVELQIPEHPLGGSREVYPNPLAPEGLVRLKSWIDCCVSNHPECALGRNPGHPLPSFVPTRLIKIEDNSSCHVRLISAKAVVQYVALSYCWGTTKQPGTIRSNVSSRQQRINVSELPKTLQDAILVADILGFQYIWIDSLCIVQDDVDDWATESLKMAHIYSGACLVIAATQAKDCAEGFLHPRSEPLVLDWALPDNASWRITARRMQTHNCQSLNTTIQGQPLYGRAWAMQERELARRIVHFLPDEVLWRYQRTGCCECGISEDPSFETMSLSFPGPDDRDRRNEHAFASAWNKLLMIYGHLNITEPTDTLPALSGVARYVEHLRPGQYIAGMWEKDIALQLAWYLLPENSSAYSGVGKKTHARSGLKGPSFSWISAPRMFSLSVSELKHKALCAFVATTQTLATANPYGHVLDCSITLRGRTIQADKFSAQMKQAGKVDAWPTALMDDPACVFDELLLNANGNISGEDELLNRPYIAFFELFQTKISYWDENYVATALILQRRVGETKHKRIGLALNIDPTWFIEDGVKENVTII